VVTGNLTKLIFSIRQVSNGYLVESNYREKLPRSSTDPEFGLKKEYLLDDVFADTLPKAVEVLKQMTTDYSKAMEKWDMEQREHEEGSQMWLAVLDTVEALGGSEPVAIEAVMAALRTKYSPERIESTINFCTKNGWLSSPTSGYVQKTRKDRTRH
jgi:hypothetical protein